MKRRMLNSIISAALVILVAGTIGCSKNTTTDNSNENTNVKTSENEKSTSDNTTDNIIILDNENIKSVLSETTANPELEKNIINELELTDEQAKETKYYYNYVDLNNDNKNEIIVVVTGPTIIEDTVLIFNDKLEEMNDLDFVNNPVIISDDETNGWKNIIIDISKTDTEKKYAVLKYDGMKYSSIGESEIITEINTLSGTAIIADDMSKKDDSSTVLYLKTS